MKKERGQDKVKTVFIKKAPLEKPAWLRVKAQSVSTRFLEVEEKLRQKKMVTVCQEANCPNKGECFGKGVATFMILGDVCTRRCPFCDVAHGKPNLPDETEPKRLAEMVLELQLNYVVMTSVNRDDLEDGGAKHYCDCIAAIRESVPNVKIEVLTPDFRGKEKKALALFKKALPDVMNHNLETIARLYREVRPGANYQKSLALLKEFKAMYPSVKTKSGIMVGLGETDEEVIDVLMDLRKSDVDMVTIGQYLQPSPYHLPVKRYVTPDRFLSYEEKARRMGFSHAASGVFVRSSYHAEENAQALIQASLN